MKKYDLLVAGGGLTGVAAAVAAAREGLKVLLVEKEGCLGGSMSNCLVFPYMRYWFDDNGTQRPLSAGLFTEMRKRQTQMTGRDEWMQFSPEHYKFLLDDMIAEAGVDVLFHSRLYEVGTQDDKVKSVKLLSKSGTIEVEADFFVDATGDGDLFALAGCDFQVGRDEDGLCQPMTTCFRVCGVDVAKFDSERAKLQTLYKQFQAEGRIKNPRENLLIFSKLGDGILHFNTTRITKHNPLDVFDLSKAEVELRRQVLEMFNFVRENSEAFEHATLISIAGEVGIRESRKLKGVYILQAQELIDKVSYEDTIALGNYAIDIHNPAGTGTTIVDFEENEYYQIPYRCLLPKEYTNLWVAGRCISATHEAQSAVRIMPICANMGEAAGVAAGVAYNTGKNAHTVDVSTVREKLISYGAQL